MNLGRITFPSNSHFFVNLTTLSFWDAEEQIHARQALTTEPSSPLVGDVTIFVYTLPPFFQLYVFPFYIWTTPTYTDIKRVKKNHLRCCVCCWGSLFPPARVSTAPQPHRKQPSLRFLSWWQQSTHLLRLPRFRSLEVFSFCVHFWMAVHATIYFSFSASNLFLCCLLFYKEMYKTSVHGFFRQPSLLSCRPMCVTGQDWGYWGFNPGPCACSKCSPLNHVLGIYIFCFETGSVLELLM